MKTFIITGCSEKQNLGFMIARQLKNVDQSFKIISVAHHTSSFLSASTRPKEIDEAYECDLSSSVDTGSVCKMLSEREEIFCLINCAGLNTNKWFEESTSQDFDTLMAVNARASYEMSRGLVENIAERSGTILNIVSNAAHVPMTCSLAYNASKAAAKMITTQMAHELTKKFNITVFSVSPNKLDGTDMSLFVDAMIPEKRGWTEEFSKQYQLDALKTGRETDPNTLAEFIAFLLSKKQRHFFLSGCDIPYGA